MPDHLEDDQLSPMLTPALLGSLESTKDKNSLASKIDRYLRTTQPHQESRPLGK